MGYPTCMTDVQNIGAGASYDVQPGATQEWRVTEIGSDRLRGVPPNAVPDVTVSLFDGTRQGHFQRSTDVRGWYRKKNWLIGNANYLRLTNDNAGVALVSFSASLHRYKGAGNDTVMSDVQNVGAGAIVAIQPPATEDWKVTDIGSDIWLGAAPNGVPNVEVDIFDGTNAARVLSSINVRQWEPALNLFVNNGNYLLITNSGGVAADIAWSAELIRRYGAGASIVKSDVQVAGAGANVDFQPPDGEEWEVNMIAGSVWTGIAPLQFPDVTASLYDGTNASPVQNAANWMLNGHEFSLTIDHDNYLRVNDAGGAGQNVGISAQLVQRYA